MCKWLLLVAVATLLCGCEQAPDADSTYGHGSEGGGAVKLLSPCPGFAETGKPALVYGAECGQLLLPENPADPTGKKISVAILRLPALSPSPQKDPLFLIQGGPGGSSIAMAEQLHAVFAEVRKNRDLIFVDQRGTGSSNPLTCPALSDAEQQLPEAQQLEKYLALMRQCAEQYAPHIPYYTTPYAVADLDAVRAALGYERINLWGGSYGTRVVLEYMRTRPAQLRSVVMDGLAPVQIALPSHFAASATAALAAVNAECAALPACVSRYGDIVANAEQVYRHLQSLQRRNAPLQVAYEHPRYQVRESVIFTPRTFSSLVFMALYSRDLTVLLPRALADAAAGDYRLLAALHALANNRSGEAEISEGMHFTVVCNEDAHFINEQTEAATFLGMSRLADMREVCRHWPKAPLPAEYFLPVASSVPALLLSGGRDPVTPGYWAQQVAQHLEAAWVLAAPGGNHIVSQEGCTAQLITQFIAQGHLQGAHVECMDNIKPLPLVLGADTAPQTQVANNKEPSGD